MGATDIASCPEDCASSIAEYNDDCINGLSHKTTSAGFLGSRCFRYLLGAFFCSMLTSVSQCHTFHEPRCRTLAYRICFVGSVQQRAPHALSGRSFYSAVRASKVDEILADLKELTLLETSELVKKIEETFGVSATMAVSAPAPTAGGPAVAAAPEEEEDEEETVRKTSFEVVLLERPEDPSVRMALFRALRKVLPDKPLTDVKAAIDNAPTVLKVVGKEDEAKEAIKIIEGAGGKGEIR
ncbi:hypothetical protein X943_002262 [Babesia divergens]|uniref:Large ribosomal subunit protein bL12 oligomerization domain-containing protein n=1 Tax=Babesia divergens TaxID=32595 RepID=A0AAD9G7B8_BABDI|nr:hypothetical protein X943_002262 [Babesia divergens]